MEEVVVKQGRGKRWFIFYYFLMWSGGLELFFKFFLNVWVLKKIEQSTVQQRLLQLCCPQAHSAWICVSGCCRASSAGRKAPWPRAVA